MGASSPLALWTESTRTVSGSPGRVDGRSGSSRALAMRSARRLAKPRRVRAPRSTASRARVATFSRLATWASPRRVPVRAARIRVSS